MPLSCCQNLPWHDRKHRRFLLLLLSAVCCCLPSHGHFDCFLRAAIVVHKTREPLPHRPPCCFLTQNCAKSGHFSVLHKHCNSVECDLGQQENKRILCRVKSETQATTNYYIFLKIGAWNKAHAKTPCKNHPIINSVQCWCYQRYMSWWDVHSSKNMWEMEGNLVENHPRKTFKRARVSG